MLGEIIDVTSITRVFGCTSDYYFDPDRDHTYDEYTLYLVRDATDSNGVSGVYTDAYYGDRKVTDVLIIDKEDYGSLVNNDTAGNLIYPDDKIYLVPYYNQSIEALSGQDDASPVGYNIYYKHDGIVLPVSSSVTPETIFPISEEEIDFIIDSID